MTPQEELAALRNRVAELQHQLASVTHNHSAAMQRSCPEELGLEHFRAVFVNYDGGMVFSREGVIFEVNEGFAKLVRAPRASLIGKRILELIVPEDRDLVNRHIVTGDTSPYEHRMLLADGTVLPVETTASLIPACGKPWRFTVVRDISDRLAIEEALNEERNLLRVILENIPAGIFVAEVPSGRPVLVNEHNRKLLGKPQIPDVTKDELAEVYQVYIAGTDELYPIERMPIVRAMSGERSAVDDMERLRGDGTRRRLQITGAPIYNAAGKITLSVVVTQDITDQKLAETRLREEQDFLRAMLKAHERDRQLLAYEVHDGLVQYITAAVWHVESVLENGQLDDASRQTLDKTQGFLRTAIVEARRVLSGLRPPVLDERGIVPALEYLVAENATADGPQTEFVCDVRFGRLDPLLEGTIFRMVQESLNNVRKHSGATAVMLRLTQHDQRLRLTITDNGCGFEARKHAASRFGLQGISKRAELIGGSARIESEPGIGTTVIVDLPLIPVPEAQS